MDQRGEVFSDLAPPNSAWYFFLTFGLKLSCSNPPIPPHLS